MIKITNGVRTVEVTNGAFQTVYKQQGYRPVDEVNAETATTAPAASAAGNQGNGEDPNADEKWLLEIAEKPLSQWSKEEVKRFAALNHVDLTGTKNVNEAKELIGPALDEFLGNKAE